MINKSNLVVMLCPVTNTKTKEKFQNQKYIIGSWIVLYITCVMSQFQKQKQNNEKIIWAHTTNSIVKSNNNTLILDSQKQLLTTKSNVLFIPMSSLSKIMCAQAITKTTINKIKRVNVVQKQRW